MSDHPSIRYSNLPPGAWRVAWLGDVAFHNRQRTYSQPSVTVVLESLEIADVVRSVPLPIAQLWAVSVGTVWHDGVLQGVDASMLERDIEFSVGSLLSCVAGSPAPASWDGWGVPHMLPFHLHRFHQEHTKSPCLVVDDPKVRAIIPALEIIRFYFGSSGSLLKQLFSAHFDPKLLYQEAKLGADRIGRLKMAPGISMASAEDVARIAFNPTAASAAKQISRSLVSAMASAAGDVKAYPKTILPISGRAKLRVRGMLIREATRPAFLVQQLVQCAAPLPWIRLEVACTMRASQTDWSAAGKRADQNSDGNGADGQRRSKDGFAQSRVRAADIDSREPRADSAVVVVKVGGSNRFIDLNGKPTSRVSSAVPRMVQPRITAPAEFDSTGDGVASSAGRRTELVLESSAATLSKLRVPVPRWRGYFKVLEALVAQPGMRGFSFVPSNAYQAYTHYGEIPVLVDDDGVIVEETVAAKGPGSSGTKLRLASFVVIATEADLATLISLAPRDDELLSPVMLVPRVAVRTDTALRTLLEALAAPPEKCVRIEVKALEAITEQETSQAVQSILCALDAACSCPLPQLSVAAP